MRINLSLSSACVVFRVNKACGLPSQVFHVEHDSTSSKSDDYFLVLMSTCSRHRVEPVAGPSRSSKHNEAPDWTDGGDPILLNEQHNRKGQRQRNQNRHSSAARRSWTCSLLICTLPAVIWPTSASPLGNSPAPTLPSLCINGSNLCLNGLRKRWAGWATSTVRNTPAFILKQRAC